MFRLALLIFAVLMVFMIAITLIISIAVLAAMALAVGIPLYLVFKRHQEGVGGGSRRTVRRSPVEALQDLYAEGKIDLAEFERRVARLVAIEH